jgi:hypothetical protein
VKDENGDLRANHPNILNRWKNYFSQLLNVHGASDVRQIEIHTTELLVPDRSPFAVEIAIANLKSFKSPGSDQILAGGETVRSEIHKLVSFIWNKEELLDKWKESVIVRIYKKRVGYHCYQLHPKLYPVSLF